MKKKLKIIFTNYAVFCVLLISIELCLQLVYFIVKGNFIFNNIAKPTVHQEFFEQHPYLVGRPKRLSEINTNEINITSTIKNTRYTGADLNNDSLLIKIGTFGGSTTFGTGVTDEDSWPALLQKKLGNQYAVINYGVPGYSTTENIIQMALIAPEEKLDIVIFYEGWNDIRNYHDKSLGADYYNHGMQQYTSLRLKTSTKVVKKSKFDQLKDIFVTFKLAHKVKRLINSKDNTQKTSPKNLIKGSEEPDPFVDHIYKRNLKTLKILSDNIDAYPIFIPQVLNYDLYIKESENIHEWSKNIQNKAIPKLMNQFNRFMDGLCDSYNSDCMVLNEVSDFHWQEKHFLDHGHLSKYGGLIISDIVAKRIKNLKISKKK